MADWNGQELKTAQDTVEFYQQLSPDDYQAMMRGTKGARVGALKTATGIITQPGSVYEPGCGEALMVYALPPGCTYTGLELPNWRLEQARKDHATHIAAGRVNIVEGDLFEEIPKLEDQSIDWMMNVGLLSFFPEETAYEILQMQWEKTKWGLAFGAMNKNHYSGVTKVAAGEQHLTALDPDKVEDVVRSLPGLGSYVIKRRMKRWSGRKMMVYIYRDSFDGPCQTEVINDYK